MDSGKVRWNFHFSRERLRENVRLEPLKTCYYFAVRYVLTTSYLKIEGDILGPKWVRMTSWCVRMTLRRSFSMCRAVGLRQTPALEEKRLTTTNKALQIAPRIIKIFKEKEEKRYVA